MNDAHLAPSDNPETAGSEGASSHVRVTGRPDAKPEARESKDYRRLFVLGSPRSGTTWVQLLLDRSPAVATAPETQIFAYYLDHFRKQWKIEHTGPGAKFMGGAGLHRLLSEKDFRELCTEAATFVLDRIHARNPRASIVLEKSPRHALLAGWILDLFPDAYILHVIRDPRDTAASIMRAAGSWGRGWAPANPVDAGRLWKSHVEGARTAREKTALYREVRYEDLRDSAVSELYDLFQWLDIPTEKSFCVEAVETCELERLRKGSDTGDSSADALLPVPGARTPKGFFGKGSVGGWREQLSRPGIACVESVCFELMKDLGYEPMVARSSRRTLRILLHDAIGRVRESIDWQLERLMRQL